MFAIGVQGLFWGQNDAFYYVAKSIFGVRIIVLCINEKSRFNRGSLALKDRHVGTH